MTQDPTPDPFNPFAAFSGMRDSFMESWSKAMVEAVNSEEYAKATGEMLDNYLAISAPFQKALEQAMARSLAQFNMPSRQELTSLAERVTNIEMKLDDVDAKLDELLRSQASRTAGSKRPQTSGGKE